MATTPTCYTHNAHNAQKPFQPGNSADCADSAYRDAEEANSRLLEDLAGICRGLGITSAEVKGALAPEDIADWRQGVIGSDTLASFAYSLEQRREMNRGKRPADHTAPATCRRCGPIWLWFAGEVLGCPWCWNRVADRPIPRPVSVHCGDCMHFERTNHPYLGHCAKGEPEAIVGWWDMDWRYCERCLPRPQQREAEFPK